MTNPLRGAPPGPHRGRIRDRLRRRLPGPVRADRDRRRLPGRLSGRSRRRQRRRQARRRRLGGGTCAWYENPTWKKRVVTDPKQTPGIISSATADLDGDGKAEIAIAYEFAMNSRTKGKLCWRSRARAPTIPGTSHPGRGDIGSFHRRRSGEYPSARGGHPPYRLGRRRRREEAELVVPAFGRSARPPAFDQEPAICSLRVGADPKSGRGADQHRSCSGPPRDRRDRPRRRILVGPRGEQLGRPTFVPDRFRDRCGRLRLPLPSSLRGPLATPQDGGERGSRRPLRDGRRFLATVEPWHGTDVAVYSRSHSSPSVRPPDGDRLGEVDRHVGPVLGLDRGEEPPTCAQLAEVDLARARLGAATWQGAPGASSRAVVVEGAPPIAKPLRTNAETPRLLAPRTEEDPSPRSTTSMGTGAWPMSARLHRPLSGRLRPRGERLAPDRKPITPSRSPEDRRHDQRSLPPGRRRRRSP